MYYNGFYFKNFILIITIFMSSQKKKLSTMFYLLLIYFISIRKFKHGYEVHEFQLIVSLKCCYSNNHYLKNYLEQCFQ